MVKLPQHKPFTHSALLWLYKEGPLLSASSANALMVVRARARHPKPGRCPTDIEPARHAVGRRLPQARRQRIVQRPRAVRSIIPDLLISRQLPYRTGGRTSQALPIKIMAAMPARGLRADQRPAIALEWLQIQELACHTPAPAAGRRPITLLPCTCWDLGAPWRLHGGT